MKIVNDGINPMIIVDPHNQTADFIEPGNSSIIDPTIRKFPHKYLSWLGLVTGETINFYVIADNGTFYLRYRLIEKYCDTSVTVTLSMIKEWVTDPPSDRFTVTEFQKRVVDGHTSHTH